MKGKRTFVSLTKNHMVDRNLIIGLVLIVLFVPLFPASEFYPWRLFDDRNFDITLKFLSSFYPPKVDVEFLSIIFFGSLQTIAIATVGLVFALIIGVPASLLITNVLSFSKIEQEKTSFTGFVRYAIRLVLIMLRSIPEIVWALIFVRVVGLGPMAGILAIGLTYGGMLGKVYAEILESAAGIKHIQGMQIGYSRFQILAYVLIPQSSLELVSYTVYRWECAIRSTVIMGFVGAGGLGFQLESSLKMLHGGEVLTILIAFVVLVWLADQFSSLIRRSVR